MSRTGTLTVAGQTFTVTQSAPPTMAVDKTSFTFAAVSNGVSFVSKTATQILRLSQSGLGTVSWMASTNQPWLIVSPASGTGSAALNISTQFASGLPASSTGAVTITFSGAANTVAPIAVTLAVVNNGASTAPFGSFDTPLDGTAGVTGSLAVTGWAVDDVQVTRIRIVRDAVAGEAPGTQTYIGDASFVDGARPDVAAANPKAPMNTRAGWGYLLLTNFLPGLGNGTFRLSAYADDADGHTTLLGTKTVTCTNGTATTPFGAIDTPGQGQTISGIVNNFGWVLSPGTRRADPLHGGNVVTVIDGAVVGNPGAWVNRDDLTALFPAAQFSGVANALGVYTFDSTTLTNGVHTISWVVTDNQGGAAGIGSRYFTVSNGAGQTLAPAASLSSSTRSQVAVSIEGRRGPDLTAPFEALPADAEGVPTLRAEELDRIELQVHASAGRLRTQRGDRPLPIGSRIDTTDGSFTWQPGPGFLGRYDLVFDTAEGERRVRVILNPQGTFTRPQVVIDAPAAGQLFTGSFSVGGWAVDPAAKADSGIDTIHVWAYPVRGGVPIFLGATTPSGERPDVAAIYGGRALWSGFGLSVDTLPPGEYDLAVFAWSRANGEFLPARTVRVAVR
jgi:hypothetical protein